MTKPPSLWRQGSSRVPQHLRVIAVMGGIDLDFPEAVLCPDVSEVSITSVMGGEAVIVPARLMSSATEAVSSTIAGT